MKKLIFFFLYFSGFLYAQETNLKSPFVSANFGAFVIAKDQFEKEYNSKTGPSLGISGGVPLSERMYIFGKVSYFFKNGAPVIYTYSFQNGKPVLVSESKDGTAKFHEWIINAGLLYNIFLSKDYTLGIKSGATFVILFEERKRSNGSFYSTSEGKGLLGFFTGINVERNFDNSQFSIVGDVQYNFSNKDISSFVGNYGGLNIMLGLKYYFKDHRRE